MAQDSSAEPPLSDSGENSDAPGQGVRFEAAIEELEAIVAKLETGDVSLEESLERFERGVALARDCQAILSRAELRVDQLLADYGQAETERIADFDAAADDADPPSA